MEQRKRLGGAEMFGNHEHLSKELLRIRLLRDPPFRMPASFVKHIPHK